jgi:hypothetical protein
MTLQATRRGIIAARLHRSAASRFLCKGYYAVASNCRAATVLLLVCLLGFLPGIFQIPPVDRDEAYFAQATKQMIETGDYVDIRYQDDVRYRKPVGIYWLQAGGFERSRLPSQGRTT